MRKLNGQETYQRIFDLARENDVAVCIAGGAVVDFDKALDVDVFVLDRERTKAEALAAEIDVDYEAQLDTRENYHGPLVDTFSKIGICSPGWSPLPVHLTLFTGGSAADLLNTFDLSIHAYGLEEAKDAIRLVMGDYATARNEPIQVIRMTPTTPARLVKLTQRYFPHKAA